MTPEEYIQACLRTDKIDSDTVNGRLSQENLRLLHTAFGVVTEAAEFADLLKKHIFYGKELDLEHAKKEIGDILWYISVFCDLTGSSYSEIMQMNIEKLRARYPETFTEGLAINRKKGDI